MDTPEDLYNSMSEGNRHQARVLGRSSIPWELCIFLSRLLPHVAPRDIMLLSEYIVQTAKKP